MRLARPTGGFTLLEMMMVLVLMAILTTVVSISTRPDPHHALVEQAERVGLLMSLASDEARLRREPIDWEADLTGYRFVMASGDDRTTFAGDDMLRERHWDPPLTRLAVVDLASGTARTLVNPSAPPLRVPTGHEWVQPRWRLELVNELASVTVEFDANGHAGVIQ
jgi:general secretion pathway protein H